MPDSIKDFESAIAELERIVKQLEDGDLPLDKSLALFERGIELSRYCHDQLGAAQRRIEVVTERGELKDGSHLARARRRTMTEHPARRVQTCRRTWRGCDTRSTRRSRTRRRARNAADARRGDALLGDRAAASGCGRA